MKIYRIAKNTEQEALFDFLTRASERSIDPSSKQEFLNRAEQVMNGVVTDEYFARWLGRERENWDFGKLAGRLADEYWNKTKKSSFNIKTLRSAQYESFENVLYSVDDAREDLMREFYNKRRKKGSMMSWSVIPFARLKKIWDDYAKYGVVRDEQGIKEISNHMLKNLARLQAATELGGHSQLDPDEWAKEMGFKPIGGRNDDFYFSFLETQYGTPISDFGLPKLWKLAENLMSSSSSESKLVILDQMLNVVHQRGDLAALFIEGGKGSLDQLFLGNTEEEKEEKEEVEVANVHGWYKLGKEFLKTAVADGEFRDLKDRVTSIKDDIRGLKKDDKDIESRVKKLEKTIDDLNIGNRMFSDVKNVFTSLQRKMERAEAVVSEWNNYKKEMDDNIRRQVEKHTKARIKDVTPKAY